MNANRPGILGLTSTDPVVRANQLEQNIRFLQEQHQIMLSGLHSEIETLRQRNRGYSELILIFIIRMQKGSVFIIFINFRSTISSCVF